MNETLAVTVLVLLFAGVVLKIFAKPLHLMLKLVINTAFGFLALGLFRLLEPWLGISLGFSLFNAAVVGVLGFPGFLLLLALQWMF